jgi:hypothetical protein
MMDGDYGLGQLTAFRANDLANNAPSGPVASAVTSQRLDLIRFLKRYLTREA